MTYYYRSGARVPVTVAPSAQVVRAPDERAPIDTPGWEAHPLSPGYQLLVDRRLLDAEPSALRSRAVDLEDLTQRILASDASVSDKSERIAVPDAVTIERAELLTFPVVINETADGLLFATGDVVAQFDPATPRADIERHAREHGWSVQRTLSYLPNGYVLRPNRQVDPFDYANDLVENFGATFAHPVFLETIPERGRAAALRSDADDVREGERVAALPAAALFPQQWHLRNNGQNGATPGVDVDALGAWQITNGSPNIVICIIDSGVQSVHEAFRAPEKFVTGFDFADGDAAPEPVSSSHGTSCAAVAAAGPDTGRVLGIAPLCRILPIRRTELANHLALGEAMAWAADHGADVISCSWGIDGKHWVLPDVVRSAFLHVTTQGRRGAGCPIFWAAGNGDELVTDDEWASSEYTIAIAASTDQGRRAPYSDFGPEVDICAPSSGGVNGVTTASNGGYTSAFGGTSSAAPLAAGIAALVLAIAPHMRWFEVRDLLRATARKIDPEGGRYDARGHSPSYGYGQVDALQALLGIDVMLEAQRSTGTEALGAAIETLLTYLRERPAGQFLIAYVSARRFGILEEIQRSANFCNSLGGMLRLLADVGNKLSTSQPIEIPEASWTTVALIANTVMSLPARASS